MFMKKKYLILIFFLSIRATEEEYAEKCIKCLGKVFDLEKIVAGRSKLLFHKSCFNCTECKRSLNKTSSDSTKTYAFEPPEEFAKELPAGSIYCQRCHLERFQDQSVKSCIWYDSSTIKDEKGCPRSSSSHVFTIPKSTNFFTKFFFVLFFCTIEISC